MASASSMIWNVCRVSASSSASVTCRRHPRGLASRRGRLSICHPCFRRGDPLPPWSTPSPITGSTLTTRPRGGTHCRHPPYLPHCVMCAASLAEAVAELREVGVKQRLHYLRQRYALSRGRAPSGCGHGVSLVLPCDPSLHPHYRDFFATAAFADSCPKTGGRFRSSRRRLRKRLVLRSEGSLR